MRGVDIVAECLRGGNRERGKNSKSTAQLDAESSIESIGLDGPRLAAVLIYQATEDARQNPYGRGDNERIGQDKERIIELIAEAQWFLLDDSDEDYPCSFHWACSMLQLEWTFLRRKMLKLLREEKVLLPRKERHRLAALAGTRRMRKLLEKVPTGRHPCAGERCFRMTREVYCSWCMAVPGEKPAFLLESRVVTCSKCSQSVIAPMSYVRRPYCSTCRNLCVRDGCSNGRRPGSRASICREHHRIERRVGKTGMKMGKIYAPKFGPEDEGEGCALTKKLDK